MGATWRDTSDGDHRLVYSRWTQVKMKYIKWWNTGGFKLPCKRQHKPGWMRWPLSDLHPPPWFTGSNSNALPRGVSLRPLTGFILVQRGRSSQMHFSPCWDFTPPPPPTATLPQDTTCLESVTAGGVRGVQSHRAPKLLKLPDCSEGLASSGSLESLVPNFTCDFFSFLKKIFNLYGLMQSYACVSACVAHSRFMLFFRMATNSWTSLFNAGRWGFFNA